MLYCICSLSAALTVSPATPRLVLRTDAPVMDSFMGGRWVAAEVSRVRAGQTFMVDSDATRDSAQSFDNDMSGWKPPGGGGGAAHSLGGQIESTDTPDFLPEEGSEQAARAAGISYSDGMMGSQVDPNRKKNSGPELDGALDSDPAIYVPVIEAVVADESMFVLPEPSFKISKMEVSDTDYDLEMSCASTDDKDLVIDVKPVCMTFEDFYCGFTPDSHPSFSVTPSAGKMERRSGPPTSIKVTCNPSGSAGELVGYLCFILPEERDFSTYYKITCQSR